MIQTCLGLKDSCLIGKAGLTLGLENINSLLLNYNFEFKRLLGKDMRIGITFFLLVCIIRTTTTMEIIIN